MQNLSDINYMLKRRNKKQLFFFVKLKNNNTD